MGAPRRFARITIFQEVTANASADEVSMDVLNRLGVPVAIDATAGGRINLPIIQTEILEEREALAEIEHSVGFRR